MKVEIIKGEALKGMQTTELRINGLFVASVGRFDLDREQKMKVLTFLKEAYEQGQHDQRMATAAVFKKMTQGLPV